MLSSPGHLVRTCTRRSSTCTRRSSTCTRSSSTWFCVSRKETWLVESTLIPIATFCNECAFSAHSLQNFFPCMQGFLQNPPGCRLWQGTGRVNWHRKWRHLLHGSLIEQKPTGFCLVFSVHLRDQRMASSATTTFDRLDCNAKMHGHTVYMQ